MRENRREKKGVEEKAAANRSVAPAGARLSHHQLCRLAARWLKNSCRERCPVVFVEPVTAAFETPDVFGCNSNTSIVVEIKTSRPDFLRDRHKIFRVYPELGVGDFRYYCCPADVIKPAELPDKWGLIWIGADGKCRVVKEILTGNVNSINPNRFEKNARNERAIMYSALRRLASPGTAPLDTGDGGGGGIAASNIGL